MKIEGDADFERLIGNAVKMKVKDFEISVVDIDDLIGLKQAAGRGRDLTDIAALKKLKELRHEK